MRDNQIIEESCHEIYQYNREHKVKEITIIHEYDKITITALNYIP